MSASATHEGPLMLLGDRPELVAQLLGLELGPDAKVATASAEFTQAVPLERRADAVVTIEEGGRTTLALVVEVQLARDDEKHFSWPLYAASLHARLRCPTALVVLTFDEGVATWARRPVETLRLCATFAPIVFGPRDIPRIADEETATRMPELAVLSAIAHGGEPGGEELIDATVRAVARLDDTRCGNYIDVLMKALGEVARPTVEALLAMNKWEYQSDFAKKYFADGKAEGREEEARRLLLAILADRKLGPSDATRARVEACSDCATLERWVVRAASAASEDAVFAD